MGKPLLICEDRDKTAKSRRRGIIDGDLFPRQQLRKLGMTGLPHIEWIDSPAVEQRAQDDSDSADGAAGAHKNQSVIRADVQAVGLSLYLIEQVAMVLRNSLGLAGGT